MSLGFAYALTVRRIPLVSVVLVSKTVAVLFLLSEYFFRSAPAVALLSACLDGAMALAVLATLLGMRAQLRAAEGAMGRQTSSASQRTV